MLPLYQVLLSLSAPRVPAVLRPVAAVVYFACNLPWLLHYTAILFLALYGIFVASVVYIIISSLGARCRGSCASGLSVDDAKQSSPAKSSLFTAVESHSTQSQTYNGRVKTRAETDWRRALLAEVTERNRHFQERKLLDPSMPTYGAHLRPVSLRRVN